MPEPIIRPKPTPVTCAVPVSKSEDDESQEAPEQTEEDDKSEEV